MSHGIFVSTKHDERDVSVLHGGRCSNWHSTTTGTDVADLIQDDAEDEQFDREDTASRIAVDLLVEKAPGGQDDSLLPMSLISGAARNGDQQQTHQAMSYVPSSLLRVFLSSYVFRTFMSIDDDSNQRRLQDCKVPVKVSPCLFVVGNFIVRRTNAFLLIRLNLHFFVVTLSCNRFLSLKKDSSVPFWLSQRDGGFVLVESGDGGAWCREMSTQAPG
jgi:hypothetical protein